MRHASRRCRDRLSVAHSCPSHFRRLLKWERLESRVLLSADTLIPRFIPHDSIASSSLIAMNSIENSAPQASIGFSTNSLQSPKVDPLQQFHTVEPLQVLPHEWIIQFSLNQHALSQISAPETRLPEHPRTLIFQSSNLVQYLYQFEDPQVEAAVLAELVKTPGFSFAEPNMVVQSSVVPNDPNYPLLWGLEQASDKDIDASSAWDLSLGSSNVVVGVIDTGIDYTHEDLANNIWTNPAECPAGIGTCVVNGTDEDGNGYIDDFYGWDFINNDNDPFDDNSHGTHVAGTISAVGNNGKGVVGVNWNAKLMALKFLGASGSGSTANGIAAVNYATMMNRDFGVNIPLTNNSWGGSGYSQALFDAISASRQQGMLFIAAAGNNSTNNDITPYYPSSYNLDNVISVASTNTADSLSYFSNYGSTSVDLSAPGESIYSTLPYNGYGYKSGTSMAAPHVAGVAALAWAASPALSYAAVRDAILNSVDPVPALQTTTVTGGRLNANATLGSLGLIVTNTSPGEHELVVSPPVNFTVQFSHPVISNSVQASDFKVNSITASSVALTNSTTAVFHFNSSPVTVEGNQTMSLVDGSILRQSDSDPVAGITRRFYYDPTPLQVIAISPASGSLMQIPNPEIVIDFNEPIAPGSIGRSDLILSAGRVDLAVPIDSNTVKYRLTGLTAEQTLNVSLAQGEIVDLMGLPVLAFSANFELDFGTIDFPAELDRLAPLGSLIRRGSFNGRIHSTSDLDSFELYLQAGQSLSAAIDPNNSLATILTIRNPLGATLQSATGSVGQSKIISLAPIATSGNYRIEVSSASGTVGEYGLSLLTNAHWEQESFAGSGNDSQATAQPTTDSLVSVPFGLGMLGIVGGISTVSDADWYQVALVAGQRATISLSGYASSSVNLELRNAAGTILATGISHSNISRQIADFLPTTTGNYFIKVSGQVTDYGLSVALAAAFDTESNNARSLSQNIDRSLRVIGHLGSGLTAIQTNGGQSDTTNSSTVDGPLAGQLQQMGFSPEWIAQAVYRERDGILEVLSGPRFPSQLLTSQDSSAQIDKRSISLNSSPEGDYANAAVFTPDGTKFLIAHRDSGNVIAYNSSSRVVEKDIVVGGQPSSIAISPNGQLALTTNSATNSVSVIELSSLNVIKEIPVSQHWPYLVKMTPDGQKAVVATLDGFVIISLSSLQQTIEWAAPDMGITSFSASLDRPLRVGVSYADFAITPNSQTLVVPDAGYSTGNAARLRLFDVSSGTQTAELNTGGRSLGVAISADGNAAYVPTTLFNGASALAKINLANSTVAGVFATTSLDGVNGKSWLTPDQQYVVTPGLNSLLFLRVNDGSTSSTIGGGFVRDFTVSFDQQYLFTSNLKIIAVNTRSQVGAIPAAGAPKTIVAASPSGYRAVAIPTLSGEDLAVFNIQGSAGSLEALIIAGSNPEGDAPVAMALSSNGQKVVTANYTSKNISIVDLNNSSTTAWIDVASSPDDVALTSDGQFAIVTLPAQSKLAIVNLVTQTVVSTLSGLTVNPRHVVVSTDNSKAFVNTTGDANGLDRVYFVNLNGAASAIAGSLVVGDIANDITRYAEMALSPDGSLLAVPVTGNNQLVLISTISLQEVGRVSTGSSPMRITFSQDGSMAYTLNEDSVSVIEVSSRTVKQVIGGLSGITELAVDAGHRFLYATTGIFRQIRVIDLQSSLDVYSLTLPTSYSANHLSLIGDQLFVEASRGISTANAADRGYSEVYRFFASGPDTKLIDRTALSGWSRQFAWDNSRHTLLSLATSYDAIDLVSYNNAADGDADYYTITPQVGDVLTIDALRLGNATGPRTNSVEIGFDVIKPNGTIVAQGVTGPLTVTITELGSYVIQVYARGLSSGEYMLNVAGVTQPLGPVVRAISPLDNSVDIKLDSDLVIDFDRAVLAGTGNLSIRRASDDSIFWQTSFASAAVTIAGSRVTISPPAPWELTTEYYVTIDQGAVVDSQLQGFLGVSGKTLWSLATGYGHDFGDAPAPYPVLQTENGAIHSAIPNKPRLGSSRDIEFDGVHSSTASSDDATNANDEEGARFGLLYAGQTDAQVIVNAQQTSAGARLDAWIDFNRDGTWGGPFEQIANAKLMSEGDNLLRFDIPSWVPVGTTYARFRISSSGNLGLGGSAADGEVEDYAISIYPPIPSARSFSSQTTLASTGSTQSIDTADFDDDGDMDLLSARNSGGELSWYENVNSSYVQRTVTTTYQSWVAKARDIDLDGDPDVISADLQGNIYWHENRSGRFTAHFMGLVGAVTYDMDAADMDGDGDMDIVVLNATDYSIELYENDGNQVFTKKTAITGLTAGYMTTLSVADMDRDGDHDLLVNAAGVSWYENINGGFVSHLVTSDFAYFATTSDVDRNGYPDVLVATYNKVAWYRNNAGSSFIGFTIGVANQSYTAAAADMDGDGDMDVAASLGDGAIAWFENNGLQSFAAHDLTTTANSIRSLVTPDLDNDGDLDILFVAQTSSQITSFLNQNGPAPSASAFSPADNSLNASVKANLALQFDRAMQKGIGTIELRRAANNSLFESIDVASMAVVTSGTSVSINPSNDLEYGVNYYVTISAAAFEDGVGNPFVGFTTSTAWDFRTVEPIAVNLTDSYDTGFSATDDVTRFDNSSLDNRLVFTMVGSVAGSTVELVDGTTLIGSALASSATTTLTTNGSWDLVDGQHSLVARLRDPGGIVLGDSPLLTLMIDTIAPPVPPIPDLNATDDSGYSSTDNITRFATTTFAINTGSNYFRFFVDNTLVGGRYGVGATYTTSFSQDSIYAVSVRAVDVAGNESAQLGTLGVKIDRVGPSSDIVDITPDPRATSVAQVVVTFNEAVAPFSHADVTLTRQSTTVVLNALNNPTTSDNLQWTIPNLGVTTAEGGAYQLGLVSNAVFDLAGNQLVTNASDSWFMLGTPIMHAEPPTSPTSSNTVSWSTVPGNVEYFAEYDDQINFGSPNGNSGWISANSHTFVGLIPSQVYYYRVKARLVTTEVVGSWTQTSQAEFTTGTLTNVSTSSAPGEVRLATNPASVLFFEGFENGNFNGWTAGTGGGATRQVTSSTAALGSLCFTISGGSGPFNGLSRSVGSLTPTLVEFYVRANSTNRTQSSFVIGTSSADSGQVANFSMNSDGTMGLSASSSLYFGTPYIALKWYKVGLALNWQNDTMNFFVNDQVQYSNIPFRASSFGGNVNSVSQVYLFDAANAQQSWWDNIRFTGDIGEYRPSGNLVSPVIDPLPLSSWRTLSFHVNTLTNTAITVDVLSSSGGLLASSVASGTNLSSLGIGPVPIRLRANLSSSVASATPSLLDWSVGYAIPPQSIIESGISNIVPENATSPPTDVAVSNSTVNENTNTSTADLVIGQLSAIDLSWGDTHTFTLVSGAGDIDNSRFTVIGSQLLLRQNQLVDYETKPSYSIRIKATDSTAGFVEKIIQISVNNFVEISKNSVQIQSGELQRSRVTSLSVQFDGPVVIAPDAFLVTKRGSAGGQVGVTFTTRQDLDGRTIADLSFFGSFVQAGSLIDGNYELTIVGTKILSNTGHSVDTNSDGIGGDNLAYGNAAADLFFRLFGDSDGDRDVDAQDYGRFGLTYRKTSVSSSYNSAFDYDQDGDVDAQDYGQFGLRYRKTQPFE